VKGDANTGNMGWYGVLKKIICLDFHGDKEVMLFQCVWFDVPAQVVADREGTLRINMGSSILISLDLGIQMNLTS
jgi:hypothetical protein